jgi:ribonuclease R
MTERRADEATRDVMNWLKCYFMKDHVGESFAGTISSVTSFGIFVSLDEVFVEGLVHVSDLGQDYFKFDAKRHVMSGERTGKRFRLGDRVTVRVARVDLETSRIDFMLDEHVVTSGRRTMTLTRAPEPVDEEAVPAPAAKPQSPFKPRDIEKREAKAVSRERKEDKQAKKPRSTGALLSGKKKR